MGGNRLETQGSKKDQGIYKQTHNQRKGSPFFEKLGKCVYTHIFLIIHSLSVLFLIIHF